MKAWSASAVPGGQSTSNVVTQVSSDTESVGSSPSAKSRETSPTASPMMPARRLVPASSGDELENEPDPGQCRTFITRGKKQTKLVDTLINTHRSLLLMTEVDANYMGYSATRRHCMSKAAVTHTFRKLKTPSRCRECDSYVYFQGAECVEVSWLYCVYYSCKILIHLRRCFLIPRCRSAGSAVTRNVSRV